MARNKHPEQTVNSILDVASELFYEKGYDNTSLQEIIDKTGFSKGAIYHHFKSKEDIFESICDRIGKKNMSIFAKIRKRKDLNGSEKLKKIFHVAFLNPNLGFILNLTPNLLDNPRFLAMQIRQIYEISVPEFIEPILCEGIDDGSINAENPREIAEAIMILSNIWLNPLVRDTKDNNMHNRYKVFSKLFRFIGIELMEENLIDRYVAATALRVEEEDF